MAFPHPLNWRSTLLGVLLLFAPSLAGAQVNIEKIRDRGHEEGLAATVKLDLATRSGNVDVTRLDTDVRVDFVANQTVSFVLIRGGFGWINGERFSNEALAHARLSYGMSTRVDAEAFGQIDYDKSRLLDFRALAGAGIRTKILNEDDLRLIWGSAVMLEHEKYDLPVTARHPTHETVGRWSNYLNVVADNGALSLSCIVYGQPRFDEFGDVRVLLEATLGFDVTERLAVTNTFRSRYDSRPPDGIEDLDTMLLTGIVLELQ